jgi:hypothetical protein
MLVLHAVCFLKMIFSRTTRECHAEPAPKDLPDGTRGTQNKETPPAAAAIDSRRAFTHRTLHESYPGSTRASLGGEGIAREQYTLLKDARLRAEHDSRTGLRLFACRRTRRALLI